MINFSDSLTLAITFKAVDKLTAELGKIERNVNAFARKSESKLAKVAGALNKIGNAMLGVGAASSAALFGAVKTTMAFEDQMSNVATLLEGDVSKKIDKYSAALHRLAVATGTSLDILTEGLYQTISAFGEAKNAVNILEVATKAAAAGGATVKDTIDLLATAMKGYGDTSTEMAQKVADLAFMTVKLGRTTFPQLASSLGDIIPIAAQTGVKIEELFGAVAAMTMIEPSTAKVTTELQGAIMSFLKPTEAMKKVMKELGYASAEVMLSELGLGGAMKAVLEVAKKKNIRITELFSRVEGLRAVLTLTGKASKDFKEKTEAMFRATGAASDAFKKRQDTLKATMDKIKVTFQVIAVQIGEFLLPVIRDMADTLAGALEWFSKLSPGVKKFIGTLIMVGAIGGTVGGVVLKIISTFMMLKVAAMTAGVAMNFALWPVIAIAGAIAGLILVIKYWGKISRWILVIWKGIKVAFWAVADVINKVRNFFGKLAQSAAEAFKNVGEFVKMMWEGLKDFFVKLMAKIIAGIIDAINYLPGVELNYPKWVAEALRVEKANKAIKKSLEALDKQSRITFKTVLDILENVSGLGNKGWGSNAWEDQMKRLAKQLDVYVKQKWGKSLDAVMKSMDPEKAKALGAALIETFATGIDKAGTVLPGTMEKLMKIIDEYLPHSPAKRGPLSRLGEVGIGLVYTIVRGILDSLGIAHNAGRELARSLKRGFGDMESGLVQEIEASMRQVDSADAGHRLWRRFMEGTMDVLDMRSFFERLMGADFLELFLETGKTGGELFAEAFNREVEKISKLSIGEKWQRVGEILGINIDVSEITEVGQDITTVLQALSPSLVAGIQNVLSGVLSFIGGPMASAVLDVFLAAFNVLMKIPWFKQAWDEVMGLVRKEFAEIGKVFRPLIDEFRKMAPAFFRVSKTVVKFFLALGIKPLLKLLWAVVRVLEPIVNFLLPIVELLATALEWLADWLDTAFDNYWKSIVDGLTILVGIFQAVANVFKGFFDWLRSIFKSAFGWLGNLFGFSKGGLVGIPSYATGGIVRGGGTSTSDSVLARLSRGEFVVRTAMVEKYYPILVALNEGKLEKLKEIFVKKEFVKILRSDTKLVEMLSTDKEVEKILLERYFTFVEKIVRAGRYAEGGLVWGPGTSTSDSILAWLSRGEFVVKASAVQKYYPVLQAINNGEEIPTNVNVTVNVYGATDPHTIVNVIKRELSKARLAVR